MKALVTFDFDGDPVRTLTIDDEPWFVGKDVCRCLGIVNHNQALDRLNEDERSLKGVGFGDHLWAPRGVCSTDPLSGNTVGSTDGIRNVQQTVCINEPGLYRLIFESRKAEAERFKRWVFHEVLPAIRRTGVYGKTSLPLADLAALARTCDAVRRTHGRAAAKALWAEMGGPELPLEPGERPIPAVDAGAHQAQLARVVEDFLGSCCERDPAAQVQARPLYQAFARWAQVTADVPTMTETMFGRIMPLTGHQRRTDAGGRFWIGLRLKAEVLRKMEQGGL